MTGAIGPDSLVSLHFSMALPSGLELISTFGEAPHNLRMDDPDALPLPVMQLLLGLRCGEKREYLLDGGEIFGQHDAQRVQILQREDLPGHFAPSEGELIHFSTPAGDDLAGTVLSLGADRVEIDFNHPLAGRTFVLRVKIISVSPNQA
jgi:FKBP-type peptidyl-prolyl cis-trans isomerase SlpA